MARASRGPKREISWSPSRLDGRRRKSRIGHHVLSGSTSELLPPYRWRGEIVEVELAELGAYRGYGTLPAKSRRSPRAGPRSSMCSRPKTSYRRIIYAHQGGGGVRRPFKAGANEVEGGGAILDGAGAGLAVGITESAGGRGADTGAGATTG